MIMKVYFPGVKKIFVLNPLYLQKNILGAHLAMLPVTVLCDIDKIDFTGEAKFSVDSSGNVCGFSEKSSLEFSTTEKLDIPSPSAWVVSLVSGKSFLIGTAEPKYPIVKYTYSSGDRTGEAAIYRYTVSHIGQISAIPIVM